MLRDGPTSPAFYESGFATGEQALSRGSNRSTSSPSLPSIPSQPEASDLQAPTRPRLTVDPSANLSAQHVSALEGLLPDWVTELTLSRRIVGQKRRDRPPARTARISSEASCLLATIRLSRRPPVGAVQQLQLTLYSKLGEWPFRHVVSALAQTTNGNKIHHPRETQLRREVLRTLPEGNELVHLEEFLFSSKGANVRFLVAKVFAPLPSTLMDWKRKFEQDHGILVLIDTECAVPSWVDALRKASGRSGVLRPEGVTRRANRLLAKSSLPSAVTGHRPRTPRTRIDLTDRNWFRVDSKECLIAEDVLDLRTLPNGHTELLVGVVDVISPGRPPEMSSRRWRSFVVGEERNAVVSRFEFNRDNILCGFSTQLACVKAHLKFTLSDLGKLLRSESTDPFVENLRKLDSITAQLGNRRLKHEGFVEVSLGGSPGKLVFEPMVLFNSANTHWLRSNGVPLLYRVPQRVSVAERRDLQAELDTKKFVGRALEQQDALRTLMLLQKLDEAGERALCHKILDGYVRSARYSTEDDSHPGFASPYTGFKPKGGSGYNQLQLVRHLSGTRPLDEPTLRASFVSMQGRGPLVAYSRSDQEALSSLARLFQDPKKTIHATVIGIGSPVHSGKPYLTVRVDGWERIALMEWPGLDPSEYIPGMQLKVRATGFDTKRICPLFEPACN